MKRLRPVPLIALLLIAVLFAGYVVYPLASMMEVSLRANGAFSLKNYVELFNLRDRANVEAVWNSVFVTLLSVLLGGCVGVFLAFVFTQFTFPLSPMLSRLAVLPIALHRSWGSSRFCLCSARAGFFPG